MMTGDLGAMYKFSHLILVYVIFMAAVMCVDSNVDFTKFTKEVSCHLQDRLDSNCAELKSNVHRSLLECAATCGADCGGFSESENRSCYHHGVCPQAIDATSCTQSDLKFTLYRKTNHCWNDGVWQSSTSTCRCVNGWVGSRCERNPVSCLELSSFGYGYPLKIWVDIKPDNYPTPFRTRCNLQNGFVTTYLMMNTGSIGPNRTWEDYVNGFFVKSDNFWIGLDKMRALNSASTSRILCLDAQFGLNSQYNLFSFRYNGFQIGDASTGYSFTFSSSGKTGVGPEYDRLKTNYKGCLDASQDTEFSTWDMDNDMELQNNCAAKEGLGWWFKNCTMPCSPLGSRNEWLLVDGLDLTAAAYAESIMYFTTG